MSGELASGPLRPAVDRVPDPKRAPGRRRRRREPQLPVDLYPACLRPARFRRRHPSRRRRLTLTPCTLADRTAARFRCQNTSSGNGVATYVPTPLRPQRALDRCRAAAATPRLARTRQRVRRQHQGTRRTIDKQPRDHPGNAGTHSPISDPDPALHDARAYHFP
jgi:hypothetical protein